MRINLVDTLAVAFKERAKDILKPSLGLDIQYAGPGQAVPIEIENYRSSISLDPILHQRAYCDLKQDKLVRKGNQVFIESDFEYHGLLIPDAKILSDGATHVSIFDAANKPVETYSTSRYLEPLKTLKRSAKIHTSGVTINLCPIVAVIRGNFAHWLLDALASLLLVEDRGPAALPIDNFLIPAGQSSFRESLESLGIAPSRVVELSLHDTMSFEQLLCVSHPRGYSSHIAPGWMVEGYRDRMKAYMQLAPSEQGKKLYVSRRDASSRKFREESALIVELEKRGYEAIELSNFSFTDKATLFAQASEIIGLSGAGMMSTMFAPENARVIELYPTTFINYQFASAGAPLHHRHIPYIFQSRSAKSHLVPNSGLFDLDISDFLSVVDSDQ